MSASKTLPQGWELVKLGDHVRFLKNGTHSRAQLSENGVVKNLHYGDIHGASSIWLSPATTPMPTLDATAAGRLDRLAIGDLVFVDASEDLAGVGTSVEISDLDGVEVVSGLHTIAARFDKAVLVDGFKAFLQFMPAFRSHLCQLAAGTKVLATNRGHIASAEIALPRPAEQQATAAALSDAEGVVADLERVITKKRLIKQGAMQDLLTARRRLPGFSGEWETVKLGACASVISKGTTPTSIGHSFVEHGINFIKVESLLSGRFLDLTKVAAISEATHAVLKRSQLQAGDILISIAGAIGRVGIVDQNILPANTNQALAFVRLHDRSELCPEFVPFLLESEKVRSHWNDISVQGAQPNISLLDVRNLNLPCPHYAEQKAIAAVLSDMDAEIQTLETRLTKARAVKEGMMQNLLTGRVRLV